ncbi:MAG: hypothetical protein WCE68_03040 [Anaerolineales bacterium]
MYKPAFPNMVVLPGLLLAPCSPLGAPTDQVSRESRMVEKAKR